MKRRIAAGTLTASEVILSCPWQAESMSISDLLMSQKRWGRARCRRLLISLGVPENKRIGTLTERQRLAMAAVLTADGSSPRARHPDSVLAEGRALEGRVSPGRVLSAA
jgi:hypothetical protein